MKIRILFLACMLLLAGCLTQTSLQRVKSEVTCSCGCQMTLTECEIEEPECRTREGMEDTIETLMKKGYTPEDVLEYYNHPLSVEEFQAQIKTEIESGRPVILYFYSETCSTCHRVNPKIEEIEQKFPVALFKIEKRLHAPLFSEYHVEDYPLLIVIVNGKEYRNQFSEHDDILSFVDSLLG